MTTLVNLSALAAAVPTSGADLVAVTQSSTGPNTGITRKATVAQIFATPPAIGGTTPGTGAFTTVALSADPTTALQATTKQYVDAKAATAAPLASPALTGTPTAPTAAPATSTTQLATTAFVGAAVAAGSTPATVAPLMDGVAAVGTSLLYARQDHVHPTDTSLLTTATATATYATITNLALKAPLANPTFSSGVFETRVAMAANNLDMQAGTFFTKTLTAISTFTVSNVPAAGVVASVVLELTNGGAFAVTWWAGTKWAGGIAPTLTAAGIDALGFYSMDGGTTWRGLVLAKDIK